MRFYVDPYTLHNPKYIHNREKQKRKMDKNKVELKENDQIKKGNVFRIPAD